MSISGTYYCMNILFKLLTVFLVSAIYLSSFRLYFMHATDVTLKVSKIPLFWYHQTMKCVHCSDIYMHLGWNMKLVFKL